MARKRRGKKKRPKRLDPLDVFAGRVQVSVRELLALIADTNPTRDDLPQDKAEERYRTKSKLQSVLIRDHANQIRVRPAPDNDRIVSIEHRFGERDACHAVIDHLDTDARAWVRLQLDLAADDFAEDDLAEDDLAGPGSVRSKPWSGDNAALPENLEAATVLELVAHATALLDAYDYAGVRGCLEAALAKSGGARVASLPLLELLVDTLGQDQDALDLLDHDAFGDDALRDPEIASLLGLAAARAGDKRATQLIAGVRHERVGSIRLLLAEAAIRAANLDEARQHLQEAEHVETDPVGLGAIQDQLREATAGVAAPLEVELLRAWSDGVGDGEKAKALATDLRRRFADNATAHRVLREIQLRADTVRGNELARRADALIATKDSDKRTKALALLSEALTLLPRETSAPIQARLADLVAEDQARGEAKAVEAIVEAVATDPAQGLARFATENSAIRRRVLAAADVDELDWLESLRLPLTARRAKEAATEAVALSAAIQTLEHDASQALEALEHLSQIRRYFNDHATTQQTRATAETAVAQSRREAATVVLARAEDVFRSGDSTLAAELLGDVDRADLDDTGATRCASLERQVQEAAETTQLTSRYERLVDLGDLHGALRVATALAERVADESWVDPIRALRDRISAAFAVRVVELPEAERFNYCEFKYRPREEAVTWLTGDGDSLVFVRVFGHYLFITLVDVASSKVARIVSLRTPELLGNHLDVLVDRDSVVITGSEPFLLRVSMQDWAVTEYRSLAEHAPDHELLESIAAMPGNRYVWLHTSTRFHRAYSETARVVDLISGVCRTIENCCSPRFVAGSEPAVVCTEATDTSAAIFEIRGAQQLRSRHPKGGTMLGCTRHPVAGDVVYLINTSDQYWSDEGRDGEIYLYRPSTDTDPFEIDDAESFETIGASIAAGLVFVAYFDHESELKLIALAPESTGWTEAWTATLSEEPTLVTDATGTHAVALLCTPGGVRLVRLGTEAPDLDGYGEVVPQLPRLAPEPYYAAASGLEQITETIERSLSGLPRDARSKWIDAFKTENADSAERLAALALAPVVSRMHLRDEIVAWAHGLHTTDPRLSILGGHLYLSQALYDEGLLVLDAIQPTAVATEDSSLYFHLLGIAHYRCGDVKAAETAWTNAAEPTTDPGDSRLLAEALALQREPRPSSPGIYLVEIIDAIEAADKALAANDKDAALDALDTAAVWAADEVQSLARLADVLLGHEVHSGGHPSRTAAALARFVSLRSGARKWAQREVPLLRGAWTEAGLRRVTDRAKAWLADWARGGADE